jgi:hypothetical protein
LAYFKSPCDQCYYFDICHEDRKEIRTNKIKNDSIRWGEIDCFKSPESHKRDFDTLPDWKKEKFIEDSKKQCFGTYLKEILCQKCHAVSECEVIKRVKNRKWR